MRLQLIQLPILLTSFILVGENCALQSAPRNIPVSPVKSTSIIGRNVREFAVLPVNSPEQNKRNLQKAIDWAAENGAALWVEPSDEPYRINGGLILKQNVSLIGVHGPVGRGTKHPQKAQPVGSVFAIEDENEAFLTVESATQVRGIQFWYPKQTLNDPTKVIAYPPTIRVSPDTPTQGVTLSSLTFYGEYIAMDFRATANNPCEQILFEHCYGYPLSGEFIRIDYCYDIPRILHCHVNPANQRLFRGPFSQSIIDYVIARRTFSYAIEHTDNAQLMDVFTFGVFGGVSLGAESYGQLTNFNLDCVTVGIHKLGSNSFNRNWQISQGSIIANTGSQLSEVHPFIIEGKGHTSISNVEAFSGLNPVLTAIGKSADFMTVQGKEQLTISLFGCRMRNYAADEPFTVTNPKARIQAVACVDKDEQFFNRVWNGSLN